MREGIACAPYNGPVGGVNAESRSHHEDVPYLVVAETRWPWVRLLLDEYEYANALEEDREDVAREL